MNRHSFQFLALVSLIVFSLSACDGRITDGPYVSPVSIQETLQGKSGEGEVLATAFVQSDLYSRLQLENYPVTTFYIEESQFDTYLSENGLTSESFLANDRLDEFLGGLVIEDVHLTVAREGTYTTESGSSVEINDVSGPSVSGIIELNANDSLAICSIRVPEDNKAATFCTIEEPLVDFSW